MRQIGEILKGEPYLVNESHKFELEFVMPDGRTHVRVIAARCVLGAIYQAALLADEYGSTRVSCAPVRRVENA